MIWIVSSFGELLLFATTKPTISSEISSSENTFEEYDHFFYFAAETFAKRFHLAVIPPIITVNHSGLATNSS